MAEVRNSFFHRAKSCPFCGKNAQTIDYKDVKLLSRFVTELGKMAFLVFALNTNVNWQKQRNVLVSCPCCLSSAVLKIKESKYGSYFIRTH